MDCTVGCLLDEQTLDIGKFTIYNIGLERLQYTNIGLELLQYTNIGLELLQYTNIGLELFKNIGLELCQTLASRDGHFY